jgi:hypothetical protein
LGPASRRISATCVLIAVLSAVEAWNFNIPMSSVMIRSARNLQTYLHRNIKKSEWRGPHKCYKLRRCGRDEGPGRLNGRVHARCLGLKAERRIRRREGERVGSYDCFNLFNRRLYDVGKGFQLGQRVLRHPSKDIVTGKR